MSAPLQKLLAWLSPAFPIGAFAWSAGLESAIAEGAVSDSATTRNWIETALRVGGLRTDATLCARAWDAAARAEDLAAIADLAIALVPAAERLAETIAMGEAFATAARAWPSDVFARLPRPCPYPVAVGAIGAAHDVPREAAITAFLAATVHGQISVAVRLVPIGQTDGLRILAALEPVIAEIAAEAAATALDDIGAMGYAADIAQMRHETQTTRIFRS
ncbi:urease accessory protein [Devosia enhydra]|uniref:Urease accessory protein UreF n=1 Tax=Devosia enhydra TaxID=665118 RepID=A0A1K2HWG5_9HYPH|nr:urease accessory UreF family protein [Devosia enhydra]SFZ82984.1 urease accessory protein [Devosia enhydra]